MRRTLYLVAGAVLALTTLPGLAVGTWTGPATIAGNALLGVGGLVFVAAGLVDKFDVDLGSVAWYQLVGVGDVCLGLGFPLTVVGPVLDGTAGNADYALLAAGVVGGFVLVLIGLDMARGGEHVRIGEEST